MKRLSLKWGGGGNCPKGRVFSMYQLLTICMCALMYACMEYCAYIRQSIVTVVVSRYRVVFALVHWCPDTTFSV